MKDSTETLIMFVQLLSVKPAILPTTALSSVQKLAQQLTEIPASNLDQVATLIINLMKNYPTEQQVFQNAYRELKKIAQPSPVTWTVPNLQIIEETETDVIITTAPQAEPISLFAHVKNTLNQWIQNNQNNQ